MRVFAEEGDGAAVEMEALGEAGEKREGNRELRTGENEVLDGNHLQQVFVLTHQLLKGGVACSRGHVLGGCSFGTAEQNAKEMRFATASKSH